MPVEWKYEKKTWMETAEKILIGLLMLGGILFLIFLLAKTFYLNRPKISAEEVAISYLKLEQTLERNLAEEFLFSDFGKVEILSEKYQTIRLFNWIQTEKPGEESAFEPKEIKIKGNEAWVKILEKTNKKEGCIFFDYYLPKEIVFEALLTKIGGWKKGYEWKITKIDSPQLILEGRMGKETETRKNIFIKPIKFEKLEVPGIRKVYSLEIEYENNSNEPVAIYPFSEWRIVDVSGEIFSPPSQTSAVFLREPTLLGGELKPGERKNGYVMFESPKEISLIKVIFKNMEKKVIFKM